MSYLVHLLENAEHGAAFVAVTGFYAFHVTPAANLDTISEEGLTIDQDSNEGRERHGAIFFADAGQALALKARADDNAADYGDEGLAGAILGVWIPEGTVVYRDDEMPAGTSYCVPHDIPLENVSIVEPEDVSGPDFNTCLRPYHG